MIPVDRRGPEDDKAPPCGAFAQCAEEDSNLHPVIPDQGLNLVPRVSYPSRSCRIVRIVRVRGRYGHVGRAGCCHEPAVTGAGVVDRERHPDVQGVFLGRGPGGRG